MIVLSFDVGLRNLAYCMCKTQGCEVVEILRWDIIDVTDGDGPRKKGTRPNIEHVTDSLIEKLHDTFFDVEIDHVLVENQPSKNGLMKMIQYAIYSFFACMKFYTGSVRHVRNMSAKGKLKTSVWDGVKRKKSYGQRKQASIADCTSYLDKFGLTHPEKFASSKKKDDLSDCFLQLVYFLEKR